MNTRLLGSWGESVAAKFLTKNKYSVIGMNYKTRFGEIDLIVKDKKYVVFVEVKLRKNADFAQAMEYVNEDKVDRIRTTAEVWLSCNDIKLQPRFDVIEIYAPYGAKTESPKINHIKNAF